jgi:signal transduction histidine kinase
VGVDPGGHGRGRGAAGRLPGRNHDHFHAALAFTVAWFAGERTRLRRAQLAEFEDRVDRAEQAAARERELAVAEERTRIARDLHDSAAHALNVIAVRAGAARLRRDPDGALATLTAVEDLARQTMADIDHFLGSLRGTRPADAEVEAPPGLAGLDALIDQHRGGGHTVEVVRTGEQRPLALPVEHGTYRIVQEALTNATRHGTGPIRVELAYLPDALALTVTNEVRPKRAPVPPKRSGGHGLIGMRERAQSLGGRLSTAATGGRYVLRARLPYTGRTR